MMGETPAASSLMGTPDTAAIPEAPSQADREAAFATITKLQRDPATRELWLRRNDATVRAVQGAQRVIHTGTKLVVNGQDPEQPAMLLGALQSFADVPDGVVAQIRT